MKVALSVQYNILLLIMGVCTDGFATCLVVKHSAHTFKKLMYAM